MITKTCNHIFTHCMNIYDAGLYVAVAYFWKLKV